MDLDVLRPTSGGARRVRHRMLSTLDGVGQAKFSKLDYVLEAILNKYPSSSLCAMMSCQ